MATVSSGSKVTLQIVHSSYLITKTIFLITKTQILQILPVEFPRDQYITYVNDFCNASNILEPIMFADDTNLLFSHRNISSLFLTVYKELSKIGEWFRANRMSLNIKKKKTNIHFFTRIQIKIIYPQKLLALKIADRAIERTNAIKLLGVLLDENTWKNLICSVEKKLAKKNWHVLCKIRT